MDVEKVKSLEQETSRARAELAEKQGQIEHERQMREEMASRLAALQAKLMGHSETSDGSGLVAGESAEDATERADAAKRLKERRQKAKAKRKAREAAEMLRIKQEKEALEEELQALGNAEEAKVELERKLRTIRKKYERRLQAAQQEVEDVRADSGYQYSQLLDAYRENERETKLFEAIARALAGDKEFKRVSE